MRAFADAKFFRQPLLHSPLRSRRVWLRRGELHDLWAVAAPRTTPAPHPPRGDIYYTTKKTKKNTHKKKHKKTKRKRTKTHPGTFRGGALARRLGPGVHVYAIWSATHIRAESYRKMNASRAVQIWQGGRKSRAGRAGSVQLDNAPEHRALLWRRWARRAGLRPLDWPSRSGDMAPRAPWRARGEHADGDYSVRSVPPGFPPRTHCGCNFLR